MNPALHPDDGAVTARRRPSSRVVWHTLGLLLVGALAWLVMRAYGDPSLMLDLANWRLC